MSSFMPRLKLELDRISKRFHVTKDKAFLIWFGQTEFDLTDAEARDAISVEGSNDKGIDLIHIDSEQGRVLIVQGKYNDKGNHTAKLKELRSLTGCLPWLESPSALREDGKP